ncbi:MAG: ABC transporter ATP-binding protein [Planctomycetes bacterium]|nr:ABC transporter ATP-binding protein [Planctomycetota bacterium]
MIDEPKLRMAGVRFGYPRCPTFLGPVDLQASAGRMLGIVGPNGAGKSTLLRLMTGLLRPREGSIELSGQPIETLGARRRACLAAFLPQRLEAPPDAVARDVVLLGRFPWRRLRFFDSLQDHAIAERALETTDAIEFADRPLGTLSSGEQQRVHLAAALAGEPELLVLDEPTAALDPYHQFRIFDILRRLTRQKGLTIVVVTHDLNLAGQHCDTLVLLNAGKIAAAGGAPEVLATDVLEEVYGLTFRSFRSESGGCRWILPLPTAPAGST